MASGHHRHRQVRVEEEDEEEEEEEEEDEEEDDEDEAEELELESDADVSPKNHLQTGDHFMAEAEAEEEEQNINVVMINNMRDVVAETDVAAAAAAASELMEFDMSESIRLGTPDDASTDMDSDFRFLPQMPHCQNPSFLPHQGTTLSSLIYYPYYNYLKSLSYPDLQARLKEYW